MTEAQKRKFKELPAAQWHQTPAEKLQRENQKRSEAIKRYAEENGSFLTINGPLDGEIYEVKNAFDFLLNGI